MLDKKALRKFAADNPAPAIPPGHGLLHAPQVDYIVRTAVKIINRRRTLILYIYSCGKAVTGNLTPVWTMFQAGSDYITLARREDGSACWRKAVFKNLDRDYFFTSKCAFYSAQDEQRVCRFFYDGEHGGMAALVRAQQAILDKRLQKRLRKREKEVLARISGLPALPRDLERWLRREVIPAYFFYDHARKGSAAGICTACGREFALEGVKHNGTAICPCCGRTMTMKPRGRIGSLFDRLTCQVIQRSRPGGLAVRIIKVHSSFQDGIPQISVWENARQFIRQNADGSIQYDVYYETWDGRWKQGERPVFFPYSYNFYADTSGYVYTRNLSAVLPDTPWQYCPLATYYGHIRQPMHLLPFLRAHLEHPRLEHLVKVGFFRLAYDLAYRDDHGHMLDEIQNRTHRILKIAAEDVPFLRELDVNRETLKIFQGYAGLKDRQRLLRWQLGNNVERDVIQILGHVTPHKFMRYMDQQYAALRQDGGRGRYGDMQHAVSEYRDYLDMCAQLGYDMGNSFILFPKDLREAHNQAAHRVKAKADAQTRRDFKAAMGAISGHLDFEQGGMRILLPATPDEIIAEGQALHHCVGGYVDRVAKKECIILFLRQCEDVDKPFFTVEVRGGKVVQVRGMRNCDATPEVKTFMAQWERRVLRDKVLSNAA